MHWLFGGWGLGRQAMAPYFLIKSSLSSPGLRLQRVSGAIVGSIMSLESIIKINNKIMLNTKHLLKVTSAWISVVYAVCFFGIALFPGVRPGFMRYGLHMGIDMGINILNIQTFISGLIIWNIIALSAMWLFALLYNKVK